MTIEDVTEWNVTFLNLTGTADETELPPETKTPPVPLLEIKVSVIEFPLRNETPTESLVVALEVPTIEIA
jgi:hypothetical protein